VRGGRLAGHDEQRGGHHSGEKALVTDERAHAGR
jgi:hypothetical protein